MSKNFEINLKALHRYVSGTAQLTLQNPVLRIILATYTIETIYQNVPYTLRNPIIYFDLSYL